MSGFLSDVAVGYNTDNVDDDYIDPPIEELVAQDLLDQLMAASEEIHREEETVRMAIEQEEKKKQAEGMDRKKQERE
ncbi:hypothetical protein BGZ51_007315 [Haplosporangium sp. Z 767]|nr:hypothetical protein BGZ50_005738 [Haplosporangium sp. Z 11]KAF9191459.1 hypothetical protein BGZ51_007315 [Haplosporangium sp. Z 767]